MSGRLRIALTKGRLQDKSVELFERMGLDCTPVRDPGRRLVHAIPNYPLDAVLAKAPDVITYVEHGVCDLGASPPARSNSMDAARDMETDRTAYEFSLLLL